MTRSAILVGLAVLAVSVVVRAEELARSDSAVPEFLALDGRLSGDDDTALPPDHWSPTENIVWKTDLPGLGWSSPIVWGDRIFITSCINTGETPEPRKGLYLEDVDANKYPKPKDKHQWKVYCLDLKTGSVLWDHVAHEGIPPKPHHIKNTLASETAATDGERVYAYFGNCGLFCYDLDGKLLWSKLLPAAETQLGWGTASSPIVHEDRLYIVNDNEEKSYLLVLDKRTGDEIFRVEREEKTNYATPYIWKNALRTELITSGVGYTRSYDLEGKLLWQIKGKSILAIPTPFEKYGNLYLAAGHIVWGKNPVYVVKPGASGDITLGENETKSEYIVWSSDKLGPYHPTPLIVDDVYYFLYDRGFMAAVDPKTGEEIGKRKRIPNGRAFTSSPWSYGGKLYFLNEDGVTFVVEANPQMEILHTNTLADDDMCMATPVIVGDKLLIRTAKRLYCVGNNPAAAAQ